MTPYQLFHRSAWVHRKESDALWVRYLQRNSGKDEAALYAGFVHAVIDGNFGYDAFGEDAGELSDRQLGDRRVDVVIPVLNEAHVIQTSVARVREFLSAGFPYDWRIVIVDNGSTDGTAALADDLSRHFPDVTAFSLPQPGRGRALRHAWLRSTADVVCYMDVDLSTDLAFLRPLVDAIAVEGYHIATGSRLLPDSRTTRSPLREFISRVYNLFLHLALATGFSDAQCGFKAASRDLVDRVVPQVKDQSWFFDTELLVLAENQGYRIKDLPVRWVEDDDSRVKFLRTAWDDIQGVIRLRRELRRQRRTPFAIRKKQ